MNEIEKAAHRWIANPEVDGKLIDWKLIKDILCGIVASLKEIISNLPAGLLRALLSAVCAILEGICHALPDEVK